MRILKIKGKDEKQIKEQIEKEYGKQAVIIHTSEERQTGIKRWFGKSQYSVTIAVNEEPPEEVPQKPQEKVQKPVQQKETDQAYLDKFMPMVESMLRAEQQERVESAQVQKTPSPYQTAEASSELAEQFKKSLQQEGVASEVIDAIIAEAQILDEPQKLARSIYMTLLKYLKPEEQSDAKINFFVGSTGVGKTTTIAKLTADKVLNQQKKIALVTADTYRIAAIEQLKTYAEIMNVPVGVIYSEEDMLECLEQFEDYDGVLVDTAGRSHKNIVEIQELGKIIARTESKKVYLILNMSTNFYDAKNIINLYLEILGPVSLIITKIDETDLIGNLINIAYYAKCPIAYLTTGQDVPDDLEEFDPDNYIKQLLGRMTYE